MSTKSPISAGTRLTHPERNTQPRWRWYHGVIFYTLVQITTFTLGGIVTAFRGEKIKSFRDLFGDVSYFKGLHQGVIAPPSAAFAPAWTINNIFAIYGLLRVLNKPASTEGRKEYLVLQGASWINYTLFNAAYFSLRSPLNALALTFIMLVLTILSAWVALFRLKDTFVALSLATLFIWLIVALTAAVFQASWNRDDLYGVGPFFAPIPVLEKQAVS